MKKVLFLVFLFGFWCLAWNAPKGFGPELLEAGCGLRVDVPYGRIDCFDSGGRWSNDPRRFDPHLSGAYGYGYPSSPYPTSYARDGINIVNPAPGTILKVEKKSGGILCIVPLLNLFCSEEKVEFSTALAPGQQQAKPQTQGAPYESAAPAPPIKEEPLPQ